MPWLAVILLAVPLAEIAVFVEVGGAIGAAPTVLLTVASAALGIVLLRVQGLAALRKAQAMLARDEAPVGAVLDGLAVLLAACLLVIPGFLTDVLGLLLFVPALRRALGRRLLASALSDGRVRVWMATGRAPPPGRGPTIEGEYVDLDGGRPPEEPPRRLPPGEEEPRP